METGMIQINLISLIQYFISISSYAYIHKITNNKIKHVIYIHKQILVANFY